MDEQSKTTGPEDSFGCLGSLFFLALSVLSILIPVWEADKANPLTELFPLFWGCWAAGFAVGLTYYLVSRRWFPRPSPPWAGNTLWTIGVLGYLVGSLGSPTLMSGIAGFGSGAALSFIMSHGVFKSGRT